jgi:hypothetical protein
MSAISLHWRFSYPRVFLCQMLWFFNRSYTYLQNSEWAFTLHHFWWSYFVNNFWALIPTLLCRQPFWRLLCLLSVSTTNEINWFAACVFYWLNNKLLNPNNVIVWISFIFKILSDKQNTILIPVCTYIYLGKPSRVNLSLTRRTQYVE